MQLIKLLKCTNCYGNLTKKNQSLHCKKCDLHFPIIKNIPAFASANLLSTLLKKSQKEYDKINQKPCHQNFNLVLYNLFEPLNNKGNRK